MGKDNTYLTTYKIREITDELKKYLSGVVEGKIKILLTNPYSPAGPCIQYNDTVCCEVYSSHSPIFIARFWMEMLPGCCSTIVSYNTYIPLNKDKDKGIGQILQKTKERIVRELGFTEMMCTTILQNEAQNHILAKHGWEKIRTHINKRTGNTVFTWIKKVADEKLLGNGPVVAI